jgi:hypothetical protein
VELMRELSEMDDFWADMGTGMGHEVHGFCIDVDSLVVKSTNMSGLRN